MKLTTISILLLALSLNFVACSSSDDSVDENPNTEQPDGGNGNQQNTAIPEKDFINEIKRNNDSIPFITFKDIDGITAKQFEVKTELKTIEGSESIFTFTDAQASNDLYIGDNKLEVIAFNDKGTGIAKDTVIYNHSVFDARTKTLIPVTVEIKKDFSNRFIAIITSDVFKFTAMKFTLNDKVINNNRIKSLLLSKNNLVKGANKLKVAFTRRTNNSLATFFLNLNFMVRDSDLVAPILK